MFDVTGYSPFKFEVVECERFAQLLSSWTWCFWLALACLIVPIGLHGFRGLLWSDVVLTAAIETIFLSITNISWAFASYQSRDASRTECANATVRAVIYGFLHITAVLNKALAMCLDSAMGILGLILIIALFFFILHKITPRLRHLAHAITIARQNAFPRLENEVRCLQRHNNQLQSHLRNSYECIESLTQILSEDRTDSEEQLSAALGQREKYENESRNLRSELEDSWTRNDRLKNTQNKDATTLNAELQESKRNAQDLQSRNSTLRSELRNAQSEHNAATQRIGLLKEQVSRLEKIEDVSIEAATLRHDNEMLSEQVQAIQQRCTEQEATISAYRTAFATVQSDKEQAQLRVSALESQIASQIEAVQAATGEKDAAVVELRDVQSNISQLEEAVKLANSEMEAKTSQVKKASETVKETSEKMSLLEKTVAELQAKNSAARSEVTAKDEEVKAYQKRLQETVEEANAEKTAAQKRLGHELQLAEERSNNRHYSMERKFAAEKATAEAYFENFKQTAQKSYDSVKEEAGNQIDALESQLQQQANANVALQGQVQQFDQQKAEAEMKYDEQVRRTAAAEEQVVNQQAIIDDLRSQLQARPSTAAPTSLTSSIPSFGTSSTAFSAPTTGFSFSSTNSPRNGGGVSTNGRSNFAAKPAVKAQGSQFPKSSFEFPPTGNTKSTAAQNLPVSQAYQPNYSFTPSPIAPTFASTASGPAYNAPISQAFELSGETSGFNFTAPPANGSGSRDVAESSHGTTSQLRPMKVQETSTNDVTSGTDQDADGETDERGDEEAGEASEVEQRLSTVLGIKASLQVVDGLMMDRYGSYNPLSQCEQVMASPAAQACIVKTYCEDLRGFFVKLHEAYNEDTFTVRSAWASLTGYSFYEGEFRPESYMGIIFWLRSLNYKLGHILDASAALMGNFEACGHIEGVLYEQCYEFEDAASQTKTQKTARQCLENEWKAEGEGKIFIELVANLVARLSHCEKIFVKSGLVGDSVEFRDVDIRHPELCDHEDQFDQFMIKKAKAAVEAKRAANSLVEQNQYRLRAWTVADSAIQMFFQGNVRAAREKSLPEEIPAEKIIPFSVPDIYDQGSSSANAKTAGTQEGNQPRKILAAKSRMKPRE